MGSTFQSLDTGDCPGKTQLTAGAPACRDDLVNAQPGAAPQAAPGWADSLKRTIEAEIIPHLLSSQGTSENELRAVCQTGHPSAGDIAAFVDLIIADDLEQIRAIADRVIVLSGGRDALLHELLTPAAHVLGKMWEQDICDFTTVTLGIYRLDQIMKETAFAGCDDVFPVADGRTILLVPAPGEQHSFGLNMVADVFRQAGWCVRSGPGLSRTKLVRLAGHEWFDIIGVSVSSERALNGLPACIRAVRQASCNPDIGVFMGGYAIMNYPERIRFLGADAMANDPRQALAQANLFVEAAVTKRLHQSMTKLVDIGRSL